VVVWLIIGVVDSVITLPFGDTSWFVQGLVSAVATTVTLPYGCWSGCCSTLIYGPARRP
jgi:uncharacterized membrane protein YhaH (DUF805 family)